jgi:ectoine hydroxylase-related dioxygenase (phytanoyl-CoA dioxygenase family)
MKSASTSGAIATSGPACSPSAFNCFNKGSVLRSIQTQGYAILHDILPPSLLQPLRTELAAAIQAEEDLMQHHYPGIHRGMVLLCSLHGGSLVNVLAHDTLLKPFEWLLGEGCIIYAYTSSSMPPHSTNYSHRIHVDCPRMIPGYITNIGATILLDDFTVENGATWFLPGSQARPDMPSADAFYSKAERVIAPAGSVFYFDARLWHAGGENATSLWRHAITINMCRPYMKQRLDIPRAMAHMDLSGIPERALQKLGFRSQTPANYDEYYAPPDQRKFRQPYE